MINTGNMVIVMLPAFCFVESVVLGVILSDDLVYIPSGQHSYLFSTVCDGNVLGFLSGVHTFVLPPHPSTPSSSSPPLPSPPSSLVRGSYVLPPHPSTSSSSSPPLPSLLSCQAFVCIPVQCGSHLVASPNTTPSATLPPFPLSPPSLVSCTTCLIMQSNGWHVRLLFPLCPPLPTPSLPLPSPPLHSLLSLLSPNLLQAVRLLTTRG